MATATWVRNELDQHGIAYEELHHPEVYTAQKMAQCEHVSGHRVAKVVCIMADGRPIEFVLPASRRVQLATGPLEIPTALQDEGTPPTAGAPQGMSEQRRKCPRCGQGTLILVETLPRQARAPP